MAAVEFPNPFRPGAGHMPPHLAGREREKGEFTKLLNRDVVFENVILTGLRGVGKTVLLETLRPLARRAGWLWVGTDMSESASVSESNLATRLLTDVSIVSSSFIMSVEGASRTEDKPLNFKLLLQHCEDTPGLIADKVKAVLERVHEYMPREYRGIVFAYDEAQNLSDHAADNEFPLSVLLEVFQSIQKKGVPFMLLLTGLPTLFPRLVEARTYAERMFHVLFLKRLNKSESKEAIRKPVEGCPIGFSDETVELIWEVSGGYPYFIQFICREMFEIFRQQLSRGDEMIVPIDEILKKLDSDFFAGRWARATDRQRELLCAIATLPNANLEFTAQEVVQASKDYEGIKQFSPSHTNQMLATLGEIGLVFKNRRGKYSFAVPLLADFINRQIGQTLPSSLFD